MLRRHRRDDRPRAGAQLAPGRPRAQGDAAEEVQRLPEPAAVRVPEEEEEREAAQGRSVGADGLVEHALPLAVPYGNMLTAHTIFPRFERTIESVIGILLRLSILFGRRRIR
jgi:hypothetical protein